MNLIEESEHVISSCGVRRKRRFNNVRVGRNLLGAFLQTELRHKNSTVCADVLNGESFRAIAVVAHGAERTHLYQKVAEVLPAFKEYQTRTTRVIPVVELRRVS